MGVSVWTFLRSKPGEVRVNDELVLDAGACEEVTRAHGPEWLIRPPMTTLFNQVLAYRSEVVDEVRAEFGLGKRVDPQEMRGGDRPADLVGIWEEMIEHIESRPLPQLRNTDGEKLFFIEDHYKLVGSTARTTLEAELAKLPDVEVPDDDERERRYRVTRASGERLGMGNTIIASIVVKARKVVVEANSHKRADGLRDRLPTCSVH